MGEVQSMGGASDVADQLDGLMAVLNVEYNALLDECHETTTRWDTLKELAGARDDHAAGLLKGALYRLQRLQKLAGRCAAQVEQAVKGGGA